jgi:Ca2+-binding EF-hand superfamily protein
LAENTLTQAEEDDLKDTFFALNRSCTGLMTRQELMDSFWNNGYPDMSYFELDNILAKVDLDNSGKISFQEFILPAINAVAMVSNKVMC